MIRATSTAMMAMTTSSSIRVKAARDRRSNAFGAHQNSLGPSGDRTTLSARRLPLPLQSTRSDSLLSSGSLAFRYTNLGIRNAAGEPRRRADRAPRITVRIVREFRRRAASPGCRATSRRRGRPGQPAAVPASPPRSGVRACRPASTCATASRIRSAPRGWSR